VLATGKDLGELRARLRARTASAVSATLGEELERSGLTSWPTGADGRPIDLPEVVRRERDGYQVVGYPALRDEGASVAVRVLGSPEEQRAAMWRGTRRLALLAVPSPIRQVRRTLSNAQNLALSRAPHGSAADAVLAAAGGPAWTAAGFAALVDALRRGLTAALVDTVTSVVEVLASATEAQSRLAEVRAPGVEPSLADVRAQLGELVYPGFVAATGTGRLADLARYLRAAARRLETLPRNPGRDREWMARVHDVRAAYDELLAALSPGRPVPPAAAEIPWMIEELRVSFFAQQLGTRYPVSEKRIYRAIDELTAGRATR
jgi:ATP-dependent helicase HrpA